MVWVPLISHPGAQSRRPLGRVGVVIRVVMDGSVFHRVQTYNHHFELLLMLLSCQIELVGTCPLFDEALHGT